MMVVSTSGREIEVAELRFATVCDLKDRVREATNTAVEQQHLFLPHPEGLPVAAIHGFRPSWAWPADLAVVRLDDARTLGSYGVDAGATVYLLVKLGVLAAAPTFSGTAMLVAVAAQRFRRMLRPTSVRRMSLPALKNTIDESALGALEEGAGAAAGQQ